MYKILFIIFLFCTNLWSCAGCVDAPAAMAGSNTIKATYDASDAAVAKILDDLIESVNAVMTYEVSNHKAYTDSTEFTIESFKQLKNVLFLHKNKTSTIKEGEEFEEDIDFTSFDE